MTSLTSSRKLNNFHTLIAFTLASLLQVFATPTNAIPIRNVLYPLYLDPLGKTGTTAWRDIASLAQNYSSTVQFWVIVNVDNGPGSAPDSTYKKWIPALRAAGVQILGYVPTGCGRCFPWFLSAHNNNASLCPPPDPSGCGPSITVSAIRLRVKQWVAFYGAPAFSGFFLDEFLPYGTIVERRKFGGGRAAIASVLKEYRNLYLLMKQTYPNITVFGNPGYVDPRFKRQKAGIVADVVSIEGTTSSFLQSGVNDPEKGSFVYYPPGVRKAFIANNVPGKVGSPTSVSSMEQVLGVARVWGAEYFVAVRDYASYPLDFFSQEVFSMSQS